MKNIHIMISRKLLACAGMLLIFAASYASSHREAPLIANDPLADNTDVYAFRSPDDPNTVTLIANYVPLQLPHGGPNYYQFGENIRYEIHVDNDVNTPGDDVIYRFTFHIQQEDPTTFFNIRLGAENLKQTYTLKRSVNGGQSWSTIIANGVVPPYNIGPRSIESLVGLGSDYATLMNDAIEVASTGEKVFCGPADDPFFVDLGGIFDLGDAPRQTTGVPRDGVGCYNVSTIAIQVPIATLQKDGKHPGMAANILDGDFTIGVWASASRPKIRTLPGDGTADYKGKWVQVSRLGMPLTNEAVIPIGDKDEWNSRTPYNENPDHYAYFYNPELGLYMDDALFGGAVPAFSPLRIQRNSLQGFDFGNGNDGLFGLKGSPAVAGTALDDAIFGTLLLPGPGKPRSVDLWPAFHTGVPNFPPYQLATGKGVDNPLSPGKPFVNNFLPNGGDMLRLNMAVPVTPRHDPGFSSNGLITAAVLGLTDPAYTASGTALQFIPNMDGFPNGRRLEDDVTRIELQAVSGVVLAAIGLWYDDYTAGMGNSPLTPDLLDVLGYSTGVENNDTTFQATFPYVQTPWVGTGKCGGQAITYNQPTVLPPTTFDCDGGTVSFDGGGTDTTICIDGIADVIGFAYSNTTSATYQFIITNDSDHILAVVDEEADFDPAGTGTCHVYGVSYSGQLTANTGDPISAVSATECFELSGNYLTVERTSGCQAVTQFTLIDAIADTVIGPLMDGDVLDLSALPTDQLNIVAETSPSPVGSVRFDFNGTSNYATENIVPYALAGDNTSGNYNAYSFVPGSYTLTATPYESANAGGDAGNSLSISFTVVAFNASVTQFTLVNSDTDLDIGPLNDGDVIDTDVLGTSYVTIRVDTDPMIVGSVGFGYDGNNGFHTENMFPYAIAGDYSGDYTPFAFSAGTHTLKATPYAQSNLGGTAGAALEITFSVVSGTKARFANPDALTPSLRLYPNPVKDKLMVEISHLASGPVELLVFDVNGAQVHREQLSATGNVLTHKVITSELAQGVYLLELIQGKTRLTSKFVK